MKASEFMRRKVDMNCLLIALLLLSLYAFFPRHATAQENAEPASDDEAAMYHEAYFVLDRLNEGLPEPAEPVNRQTPQAAMELLVLGVRNGEYDKARHALNLNLIPTDRQSARASDLAYRLNTVLAEQYLINWDELPDRPDGVQDNIASQEQGSTGPQRSILVGTLDLDDRRVEIRMQRVKVDEQDPVWVFSSNTVENIDALYEAFGPSAIERLMPGWAQQTLWSQTQIWEWLALIVLLAVAMGVGLAVRWLTRQALRRSDEYWVQELADALPLPLGVVAGILVFYLPLQFYISLTGPLLNLVEPIFYALLIGSVLWLVMRVIGFIFQHFSEKFAADVSEDDRQNIAKRRHSLTTLSVARRVLIFALVLVGLGIALSEFGMFRSLGITLLASAGVISVVVAVAAQPLLGSIVAGMQVAATEPVRIGDTVMFEGNWSEVEDISQTYVTLLTWDGRRIIVPLQYLTNNIIENWSKSDTHMIRPIYLYLDYNTDVQIIREKFEELVRDSEDYDGQEEPKVQVTETSEETMTVRCLATAATPSAAWSLHCMLLEQMLAYVRELEDGRYLPRRRLIVQQNDNPLEVRVDGVQMNNGSSESKSRPEDDQQVGDRRKEEDHGRSSKQDRESVEDEEKARAGGTVSRSDIHRTSAEKDTESEDGQSEDGASDE